MKNLKTKLNTGLFLIAILSLLASSFVAFPAKNAEAESCNSRIIAGTVISEEPPVQARFEYGTSYSTVANGGGITTPVQTFNTRGSFPMEQLISGLSENTTYYYRISVNSSQGVVNGSIHNFTLPSCGGDTSNPTVSLTADQTNLSYNGSTTVRWNSSNATSCSASGGTNGWSGSRNLSGSFATGNLTSNTTYNITCSNGSGSASDSVTITVNGNNNNRPTVSIYADSTNIRNGDSTTIHWTSSNADYCTGYDGRNGWNGSRNLSGNFNTGSLYDSSVTYSITCTNNSGSASDSVTVRTNGNNNNRPTVSIYANPSNVNYGGSSTITWNSNNADSCNASGGTNGWYGYKNLSGSFYTGSLNGNTTFSINCTNNYGSAYDSVTVYVNGNNNYYNNPTVNLTADNTNVAYNGATTIRWNTTNATYCNASGGSIGWSGTKSIGPGSFYTGSLTGTKTYSITCSNGNGSASDSVTVNVGGQVINTNVFTRTTRSTGTSLLLVTSSVDRNRPIVPTLDNTNPCPGDDINYSITYQNVGTASISGLVLRVDLPSEVDFLSATPVNPSLSGQTVIFNLGSLGANKSGTVNIHVRLRDNVSAGAPLNFPAVLSYIDPTGSAQSVNANVSANVCGATTPNANGSLNLGALVFGAGFLPSSIVGWLLLIILILILILIAKYLFTQSFQRRVVTTVEQPTSTGKKTTTTTTNL